MYLAGLNSEKAKLAIAQQSLRARKAREFSKSAQELKYRPRTVASTSPTGRNSHIIPLPQQPLTKNNIGLRAMALSKRANAYSAAVREVNRDGQNRDAIKRIERFPNPNPHVTGSLSASKGMPDFNNLSSEMKKELPRSPIRTKSVTRLQQRLAMDPWRKINRMQEAEYKKSLVDERQAVERANDLYATQLNAQVKDIVDGAEDTAGIKKVEREEANLAFKNFKSESVQKERERQEVLELNRRMWDKELDAMRHRKYLERVRDMHEDHEAMVRLKAEVEQEKEKAARKKKVAQDHVLRVAAENRKDIAERNQKRREREERERKIVIEAMAKPMSEKERDALEPPIVNEKREAYLAQMAKMVEDENSERDARERKRIDNFMRKGWEEERAKAKAKVERRARMEKEHIAELNVQLKLQKEARKRKASAEEKFAQVIIAKDKQDLQRQVNEDQAVREKNMANWRLLNAQINADMERKLAFDMMSPIEEQLNKGLLRRASMFSRQQQQQRTLQRQSQ